MKLARRILAALALLGPTPAFLRAAEQGAFLVKPYLQWGDAPVARGLRVVWHVDDNGTEWSAEYRDGEGDWRKAEGIESRRIDVGGVPPHRIVKARVENLSPGGTFTYRIKKGGETAFEATGRSPKGADQPYRFVVFGDCGAGTPDEAQVAYQTFKAKPDFVFIPGDIIYPRGRVSEYREKFWPVYNAEEASPSTGAPLVRSTLFLAAPGNHDILTRDLEKFPDGLAYFYLWDQPLNGPVGTEGGPFVLKLSGPKANQDAFRAAAGAAFPRMANFSFNYGNAHWTVLDANPYVDWTDKGLRDWVKANLAAASGATWRFVAFHQPGFNSAKEHFEEQQMRLAADLFEAGRVDVVFSGHVHNYQRSHPLRFVVDPAKAGKPDMRKHLVAGTWTLDTAFDGERDTTPEGVLYIITGGGGADLYNPEQQAKPETWQPFTRKFASTVHSLSVVDIDGGTLTLRRLSADGKELDRFVVTKPSAR